MSHWGKSIGSLFFDAYLGIDGRKREFWRFQTVLTHKV